MRELKFRVWDNDQLKFYYFDLEEEIPLIVSFKSPIHQFTGLKDKDNNDIYEGDIISNDTITGSIIYSRYGFFVEWIQNNKARITLGSPHPKEENDFSTKCKVIGNIYQNKDLISK